LYTLFSFFKAVEWCFETLFFDTANLAAFLLSIGVLYDCFLEVSARKAFKLSLAIRWQLEEYNNEQVKIQRNFNNWFALAIVNYWFS
jgi:hypothetical protein